jgi:hypothetical protein
VHHRTLSGANFFPSVAQPTVEDPEPLAHRTLSSAHRTVRCPLLTVSSATRRARITRPTVGPADRWLTGQSGALPDSPVNYSRTPLIASREQPVDSRQPGAPDTVRCTQTTQSLGCLAKSFPNWSFPISSTWTQYISLQNNVLSLRNIPLLLICTLSINWHRLTIKHLCWHSITKILRNGPRAHFPFTNLVGPNKSWVPKTQV